MIVWDLAVLKDQLTSVRAAHAELISLLTFTKTWQIFFDQKRGNRTGPCLRPRRAHVDDQEVSLGTVGDPLLDPVRHPYTAAPFRPATHRTYDVGPRARFRDRKCSYELPRTELWHITLPLGLGAVYEQRVETQVGMGPIRQP